MNEPSVKLSVVVLNHNSGTMLVDCLDSLFAEPFPWPVEVIVPDNQSTDESLGLAEKKWGDRIEVLRNGANKGFAWGNNIGIHRSSGEYVCLLNPDTIVHPGAFEEVVRFMDERPRAGFAGPKVLNKDGTFQLSAKRSIPTPMDAVYRAAGISKLFPDSKRFARYNVTYLDPDATHQVDACTGCCMFARRAMLDEIGLLDEGYFIYCEDVDWFLRAKRAEWEVWYVASAVIEHHHAYSARFRRAQAVRDFHNSMIRFHKKHFASEYSAPVNLLIYAGVRMRMVMMIAYRTLAGWG
ncbi:N-acetylglucosaminyl-diphospho-decaprenol L-rhamnosyltransferase [Pseudobythopirellula maris]|uniref:N-acetylglucosaminyl-diphospho-decaprenol L-rhamnosyltransferase n=1 Tax=Pseudobythopirellula maris TaxID=2527991 RepID=A0A5C5ZS85_9BACT|nr:glycosyltransferase family 2 protein [Pseudobythopirellula maris]TWT89817.1 N-acetylglucosaminyl-diphospho-decaprenol L-rhamnosyltransferase [Pseudobythopirellula maris]